jgi:hypothetical protein
MFGQGSFVDMFYGINMGVQSGNMMIGMGNGRSTVFSGGGAATDTMSRMMFDRMTESMFSKQGFGIQTRTMGRDATDIGRAMQILANDGAFAGKEMFSFGEKSLTARLRDTARDLRSQNRHLEAKEAESILSSGRSESGMLEAIKSSTTSLNAKGFDGFGKAMESVTKTSTGFTANEKAIQEGGEKITDFFKLMGTLQDVYGKISEAETVAMTRQLTGQGMGSNIKQLQARIETMKINADVLGVGHQQYLAGVANNNAMFAQAGFGGLGAQFGASATMQGHMVQRQSTAYAGIQADLGRYAPVVTAEQSAARQAAESAAMLNTPGMRMIAEMRYRMTYDDSLKGNAEFQGAIKGLTTARTPQEQAVAFANARNLTSAYGPVNLSNEALLSALQNSPHGAAFAEDMNMAVRRQVKGRNFQAEAKNISRDQTRFRNFASAGGGDLMNVLTSTYSDTTRDAILAALGSGDIEKAKSLMGDPALLAAEGSSPEAVLNSFSKLSEAVGGAGNAVSGIQQGVALLKHRGQLTNLVSQEDLFAQNQAAARGAMMKMSGADTRASQKGLLRTIATNLMSGGGASLTEEQVFDYINAAGGKTGTMYGNRNSGSFRFTEEHLKEFASNANFMTSLGLTVGDTAGLDAVSASDNNALKIKEAMKSGGYRTFMGEDDTLTFLKDSEFAGFESSLVTKKTGELYSQLTGGTLSKEELDALAKGDLTSDVFNAARIKLETAVDSKYTKDGGKALQKLAKKGLVDGDEASTAMALSILQGKVGNLSNKDRDEFFRGFAKDNREWLEKETGKKITDEMIDSGSTYTLIRDKLRGEVTQEEGGTGTGPMTVNGNIYVMGKIKEPGD